MSTDADAAAAEKRAADEAAAAAAASASANWPIGGYYTLIPLLLISMCIAIASFVDVSTICLVLRMYMIKYQYPHVMIMIMFYSWINLLGNLPRFLSIQKPNMCRQFSNQGFAAALKPAPFTGTYFKRWQTKTILWLTAMNVFWVAGVTPTGTITPEQEK